MTMERYARQSAFADIGTAGQEKLSRSRVAILGVGALGTVIANNLCRAGVGFLRLVDRDYVELNNLQRQVLFDEKDVADGLPKAAAAEAHLRQVNSETELEAQIRDINAETIEKLIDGVDLILDGTDNFETRFLINEACHKKRLPWIYGGALMGSGMSMNIIPGQTACLRCLMPDMPAPGSYPTCSSVGVLNMITGIVACVQSAEALKILIGSPDFRRTLFAFDAWEGYSSFGTVEREADCPTCAQGRYELLGKVRGSYTTSLCGRDSVQIVPASRRAMDFKAVGQNLSRSGAVKINEFMLTAVMGDIEIRLFKDGRAIIKNARDENAAKSLYAEYIGY